MPISPYSRLSARRGAVVQRASETIEQPDSQKENMPPAEEQTTAAKKQRGSVTQTTPVQLKSPVYVVIDVDSDEQTAVEQRDSTRPAM